MLNKKYWFFFALAGLIVMGAPLLSAIITATGAFGTDPGKRVNRIDFVWALAGLALAIYSFYKIRRLTKISKS